MRRRMSFVGYGAIGLLTASTSPLMAGAVEPAPSTRGAAYVRPVTFEPNVGQAHAGVRYVGRTHAARFLMTPTEVVIAGLSNIVRMRLIRANPRARIVGIEPRPEHASYFRGNDPSRWRTRIPTYARIRYEEVYANIDLVFYDRNGWLEYDFVVKPGGRPESIEIAFEGVDGLRVNDDGALVLDLHRGELRHHAPTVYQIARRGRVPIEGRYTVTRSGRVRFNVADYDRTRDLVIDPVLTFSSYVGGANDDAIHAVTADAAGNAYVTGVTKSVDFATTFPGPDTPDVLGDVFVSKFSPAGALLYSTYFGGVAGEAGSGVAVDGSGHAYITGTTQSGDFPTTPGAFLRRTGFLLNVDAFVAKLAPDGASLVYSTFLGGSGHDWGRSVAIDAAGQAHVAGILLSQDFPLMNAMQSIRKGFQDAFVTKLNASGSALVYSTLLGGGNDPATLDNDWAHDIAVDSSGNAYVTGFTAEPDFPLANAFDATLDGRDGFVTKLGPDGVLLFSTFLGGSGLDAGNGIAVDASGNAYVIGETGSANFPVTPGVVQSVLRGPAPADAFVAKFSASGTLVFSTFLGGASLERGTGIAVDQFGNTYLTGATSSDDFPLASPFQSAITRLTNCGGGPCFDAFVTRLNATASRLDYSSFLGGSHTESAPCGTECVGPAIAIDAFGNAWMAGFTFSNNFPTVAPFDGNLGGRTDGFLALVVQDGDRDNLPDDWETQFGVDPTAAGGAEGGSGDADGDGQTNLEELRAGTHPRGFFTRYLAEGAINAFFDVRLALLNVGTGTARMQLRFLQPGGATLSHFELLPARRRRTLTRADLGGLVSPDFSTVVESDQRIVLDRTMSWDTEGYGSHAESGVASPSTTWYLAEGSTSGDFALFYLLQNPHPTATTATVRYLRPLSAPPIERTYLLAARSRTTVPVDDQGADLANGDVSAVITAPLPIIVERAMYKSRPNQSFAAGHGSAGVTIAATSWFLAEGATGPFFDLFILVANPNDQAAQVTVDYLLLDGRTYTKRYDVPENGRFTIWVDDEQIPAGSGVRPLDNVAVSTTITSTNNVPIIVERTMWWPSPALTLDFWTEAHNSPGATATATRWALAEGEVGGVQASETYILIANTSAFGGEARVTLYFEDGATTERTFVLLPRSRTNVSVSAEFPSAAQKRFGAIVESLGSAPAQIVVERAMYTSPGGTTWAAGTNALATPVP